MSTIISPDGPALDDRPPFPVRRWSLEEYHSLINQGMFDDEHVELLEGWIVPKMTRNTKHETGRTYLEEQLRPLLGSSMYLRIQQAITTLDSEPEPDLAIVAGHVADYEDRHPGGDDVLLLVEIADSSLRKDRQKTRIYAAANVNVVWIADLQNRQLEVYSEPMAGSPEYQNHQIYHLGETVPLKLREHHHAIPVNQLFTRKTSEGS